MKNLNSFLRGLTDFLLFHLKFIGNLIKSISSTFSSISIRSLYPSPGTPPSYPSPGPLKCFPTLSCVKPLDKQFFANFPHQASTFNSIRNKKLETRVHINMIQKLQYFFHSLTSIEFVTNYKTLYLGLDKQEND